jgi:hypothetical protein
VCIIIILSRIAIIAQLQTKPLLLRMGNAEGAIGAGSIVGWVDFIVWLLYIFQVQRRDVETVEQKPMLGEIVPLHTRTREHMREASPSPPCAGRRSPCGGGMMEAGRQRMRACLVGGGWGACMEGSTHLLYMSLNAAISFFAAMIFC